MRNDKLISARRAKGWSQAQLIIALQSQATKLNFPLASPASLKTALSRWENGHIVPDDVHQRMLCQVLGTTPDEVFHAADTSPDPRADKPLLPGRIGPQVVEHFRAVLDHYIQADRLFGPGVAIVPIHAEFHNLRHLQPHAPKHTKRALTRLAASFAEFGGWLAQDSGHLAAAEQWSSTAMDLAVESEDMQLLSYVAMRRSNVATDGSKAQEAVSFAEVALRNAPRPASDLRALALRQQAAAYAQAQDLTACQAAIANALDATASNGGNDPLTGYCTPSYVQMESASALLQLGKLRGATELLTDALSHWPAGQDRDRGLCISRLANAYARACALDEAATVGSRAAKAVQDAPSARAIHELDGLAARLSPWRRHQPTRELLERLTWLRSTRQKGHCESADDC